jgi:hypothetical protein
MESQSYWVSSRSASWLSRVASFTTSKFHRDLRLRAAYDGATLALLPEKQGEIQESNVPSDAFLAQQFKPGVSGNPNGRPRKRPISEAYDDLLREPLPEEERRALKLAKGTTWAEAIALSRARHALMRSGVESAREMREAVEGKATQRFELSGEMNRDAELIVVYASAVPQLPESKPELPGDAKQLEAGKVDGSTKAGS